MVRSHRHPLWAPLRRSLTRISLDTAEGTDAETQHPAAAELRGSLPPLSHAAASRPEARGLCCPGVVPPVAPAAAGPGSPLRPPGSLGRPRAFPTRRSRPASRFPRRAERSGAPPLPARGSPHEGPCGSPPGSYDAAGRGGSTRRASRTDAQGRGCRVWTVQRNPRRPGPRGPGGTVLASVGASWRPAPPTRRRGGPRGPAQPQPRSPSPDRAPGAVPLGHRRGRTSEPHLPGRTGGRRETPALHARGGHRLRPTRGPAPGAQAAPRPPRRACGRPTRNPAPPRRARLRPTQGPAPGAEAPPHRPSRAAAGTRPARLRPCGEWAVPLAARLLEVSNSRAPCPGFALIGADLGRVAGEHAPGAPAAKVPG